MKTYIQPAIVVVRLQHQSIICVSTNSVTSNVGLCGAGDDGLITGGSGDARTRESTSVWDEEW